MAIRMKLHKVDFLQKHFVASSVRHLAAKYLGRFGADQVPFVRNGKGRKGGRYPPSRDDEFRIMVEKMQLDEEMTQGSHGIFLTSQSPSSIILN